MKKKKMLFIVISIILVTTLIYRVLFCGTIFRISLKGMNENIVGIEYTTVNILNPLKSWKAKRAIKEAYINMQNNLHNNDKTKYIYTNLRIDEDFEILDLYKNDGNFYAFAQFPTKGNENVIDKLLFIFDNDFKVKEIEF